ncbi:MAG: YwaF family protein [Christensenellales bacterium]|jgi:uncharacterized membrane protein YwaF
MEFLKDFFFGDTVRRTNYLYDTPHLIALGAVLVLSVFFALFFRKKSKKTKDTVLWVFFGILLTFEIVSRVVNLILKKDQIITILPWHFCSIMVWMMIFTILTKNKHMFNITAIGGLIATTAFLAYPAVGFNVEVLKFSQYYSVISHCLGFVLSIFLLTNGYTDFAPKNIWPVATFMVAVYIHSALANFWWYPGSNYMYYNENVFAGTAMEKWFIPFYVLAVLTYMSSFFVITYFSRKRKLKKQNSEQTNSQEVVSSN